MQVVLLNSHLNKGRNRKGHSLLTFLLILCQDFSAKSLWWITQFKPSSKTGNTFSGLLLGHHSPQWAVTRFDPIMAYMTSISHTRSWNRRNKQGKPQKWSKRHIRDRLPWTATFSSTICNAIFCLHFLTCNWDVMFYLGPQPWFQKHQAVDPNFPTHQHYCKWFFWGGWIQKFGKFSDFFFIL